MDKSVTVIYLNLLKHKEERGGENNQKDVCFSSGRLTVEI